MISLLAFCLTIFLTLKQPKIKLFSRIYLRLDYGLAPIFCATLLLAASVIDANFVIKGVIGYGNIKPYSIIILILSLSYICISLDHTGLFEYLALNVIKASGRSGRKLFIYIFLLTSLLTLFTSNDVVILTITPIILYTCRCIGASPTPFLFAQFFAANISGMGLYIGNPTNIVIADAYGVSFTEFAYWMLLPAISATLTCLIVLLAVFNPAIPRDIEAPSFNPWLAIKDRKGALFGLAVLGFAVTFMSISPERIGASPWLVALTSALVMFLYDLLKARQRVSLTVKRMPWKIAPFLIGLFVIVESLASSGWTDMLALQLSKISTNMPVTVLCIGYLSSIAAGLMNNHPMTIFFVKTLQSQLFSAPQPSKLGSMLALVIGSNLGANFMLTGALAGLMWSKIISSKGFSISFTKFSKYGFTVMPLVVATACLTLTGMLITRVQ